MSPARNITPRRPTAQEAQRRLRGTMGLLSVGLAVLGFLVAIDRPEWFHIRPATGTSVALSHIMDGNTANSAKSD
jgi:hypothetical protein